MSSKVKYLREFGKFRLDAERKVLWFENEPVNLPLKEIELLCVLTENGGEVVSKEELLNKVWTESFVEESNLARHIYLLRKTFREFGASPDLLQTVPRRGYRFTGELRENGGEEKLIIEKFSLTQTLIEELENSKEPNAERGLPFGSSMATGRRRIPVLAGAIIFVAVLGLYFYSQNAKSPAAREPIRSIAVLPVKSFSDTNADDRELRLRITDAIITKLGTLPQISVRPTSSILAFAETSESPLEIGRKLAVETVLEGRMQSEGNRLRITFQLIAVKDGTQLWSGQFDGETNKILNLQDTISQAFVTQLNHRNLFGQPAILAKNPTENPEAYENFLQGHYFFNQRGINYGESLKNAKPYFERAIELDPNFAAAIAGLADVVNLQTDDSINNFKNLDAGYARGRELALKAMELDPNLAESHTALGWIQQRYDWNYPEAEKSFKKAIRLKPNLTNAYLWLSTNYSIQGNADEALAYAKKAAEIEPTLPSALDNLARMYAQRGDCQEAIEIIPRLAQYQIVVSRRNIFQGELLSYCGRYSEAIPLLEASLAEETEKGNKTFRINATLGYCYAVTNQTEKARQALKILEEDQTMGYSMYGRILIHANLGEVEKAVNILNESYNTRDVRLTRLKTDPRLTVLQSQPRYREILRKMNL